MEPRKITPVSNLVTDPPRGARRVPPRARPDHLLSQTIQARRRLTSSRGGGRAWINGREVGGPDPRYAHLGITHD